MTNRLFFLAFIFVAVSCSSEYGEMKSSSMEPTIKKGEIFSVKPVEEVERNKIVTFKYDDPSLGENTWVFRVVGIPGDTVEIRNGVLYVNGQKEENENIKLSGSIPEPEVYQAEIFGSTKENKWNVDNYGPISIPRVGEEISFDHANNKLFKDFVDAEQTINTELFFVLGDNRHDAMDSRFIGFVPKSDILGVVGEK